jgi:hypothetical protein
VSREANSTKLTLVWFDALVDSHVYFKIAAFSEVLIADFALVGLYALVGAYVDLKAACA